MTSDELKNMSSQLKDMAELLVDENELNPGWYTKTVHSDVLSLIRGQLAVASSFLWSMADEKTT